MHIVTDVDEDGGHWTACGGVLYVGDGAEIDDPMCGDCMDACGWDVDLRETWQ